MLGTTASCVLSRKRFQGLTGQAPPLLTSPLSTKRSLWGEPGERVSLEKIIHNSPNGQQPSFGDSFLRAEGRQVFPKKAVPP